MITFDQARELVAADLPDGWEVADWGRENDDVFQVPAAPAVESEAGFPMALPVVLVDKATGAITRQPMISSVGLLNTMTPIGEIPA